METIFSKYVVRKNDKHQTGFSDCALCCAPCQLKGCCSMDCPLQDGFYFEERLEGKKMNDGDKKIIMRVANALRFLVRHIDSSIDTSTFSDTTMELCKTYLNCSLADLSYVKTLDS